jgi:catechol 2,3-dioxygenase-like lactoylglutathione lyase family enzyme
MPLNQPVCFLATDHPERSRAFYEDTLGLEFIVDEPMALVFRTGGRPLRIQKVDRFDAAPQTVLGWEVENIEAALHELVRRGVECERYEFLQQNDLGVWVSPSGAKIAWFRDPCGNLLSLTQPA